MLLKMPYVVEISLTYYIRLPAAILFECLNAD